MNRLIALPTADANVFRYLTNMGSLVFHEATHEAFDDFSPRPLAEILSVYPASSQ